MKPRHAAALALVGWWLTSLLPLMPPATLAENSGTLIVVDSSGKEVGPYVVAYNPEAPEGALLNFNGIWVDIPVTRNGFENTAGYLFFESTDCSGPSYIASNASMSFFGVIVAGDTLYYGNPATRQRIHAGSREIVDQRLGYMKCERDSFVSEEPCPSAIKIDLKSLGFEPPFSIQLGPK